MSALQTFESIPLLREKLREWRSEGQRIAFVPTMGYLHAGHLSLISLAKAHAERVVASIFVNPTQFGQGEDLAQYPRDTEGDTQKLAKAGCDALFLPSVEAIYPDGAQTFVEVEEIAQPLCGQARPTHFRGVTTVVAKLFLIVQPDCAIFGEKDFQQLAVLRQMVRDLHFPIAILGAHTGREADGLAMSSRNAYLTPQERSTARALSEALRHTRQRFAQGVRDPKLLTKEARAIIAQHPAFSIDYVEIREPSRLRLVEDLAQPEDRLFLAARIGRARLIDNAPLAGECGLADPIATR